MGTLPTCGAKRSNGQRCRAPGTIATPDGLRCFTHADPERWREAQARGREARGKVPPVAGDYDLETASGLKGFIAEALERTRGGELDTKRANALAVLAGVQARLIEAADFGERLKDLEERVGLGAESWR